MKKNGHPKPQQLERDLAWVNGYIQRMERYIPMMQQALDHASRMHDIYGMTYAGQRLEKYRGLLYHAREYRRLTVQMLGKEPRE